MTFKIKDQRCAVILLCLISFQCGLLIGTVLVITAVHSGNWTDFVMLGCTCAKMITSTFLLIAVGSTVGEVLRGDTFLTRWLLLDFLWTIGMETVLFYPVEPYPLVALCILSVSSLYLPTVEEVRIEEPQSLTAQMIVDTAADSV